MWQPNLKKGPLYLQLADHICADIVTGKLPLGQKLASARELARAFHLNPNTVIQAFQELERRGVSETKRGKGTFIRLDLNTDLLRDRRLRQLAHLFLLEVRSMGLGAEEAKIWLDKVEQDHVEV